VTMPIPKDRKARPSLSAEQTAALGRHAASSLLREAHGKWRIAVHFARMEGLEPLLAYARDNGAIAVPAHAGLRPRERVSVLSERLGLADAREISDLFTRIGIPHAFTKGAVNVPLYATAGIRPFTDLDVFVKPEDFARAGAALEKAGYTAESGNEIETAYAPREPYPIGRAVDLHCRGNLRRQFGFDVRDAIDRAVPGDVARLSAEDEVHSLAAHMARNKFRNSGRSACDIAVIAGIGGVDWGVVADRARDWKMTAATWASLACAREAFRAEIPADALVQTAPSRLRRACLRIWLDPLRVSPFRLKWRASGGTRGGISHFLLGPLLNDRLLEGVTFTLLRTMHKAAGGA